MSKCETNWQYAEQYPVETEIMTKARRMSLECGVQPVSRATAALLSATAAMSKPATILEVGTGVGVSSLALTRHAPQAHLTTIDVEAEYHTHAKAFLAEAGVTGSRLRLVKGDATQVIDRLNHGSYDLVFIDADPGSLLDYVEQTLLIVKPGGTIVIPHALQGSKVADPAVRDPLTSGIRDLLATVANSNAIVPMLHPTSDGILTLTLRP